MHTLASRLQALIRPADHIWWGQATAEPLTLTRALVEHRHAIAQGGRLSVFVGIGQSDTLQPAQADVLDFFGYAASGPHRQLARAGVLDIVPSHYSHLPADPPGYAAGGRGAGAGLARRRAGAPQPGAGA